MHYNLTCANILLLDDARSAWISNKHRWLMPNHWTVTFCSA